LCIRTATRLVARQRRGKIRQISARFHKSTVLGRDVESPSRATRGAGGSAGRNRAISSAQSYRHPAGWRGPSCSGGAAPQQT
jgi:hypothetical protein